MSGHIAHDEEWKRISARNKILSERPMAAASARFSAAKKKKRAAFSQSRADPQAAISVSGADCTDTKAAISVSGADCTDTKAAISVAGFRWRGLHRHPGTLPAETTRIRFV